MTTEESETSCDVNIYFVIPAECESKDECTEDMWHAFNKCCDNELEPVWMNEKMCAQLMPGKKDVFVMERFEGEAFQKLRSFKCSIVGPRCLLICFINAEPIPEGTSPVFTTAMRGLVVCASGLTPEEKNDVEQTVEYMGGIFTKGLRNSCTHLITNSVMSAKYEKAIEMRIPIMTEKWVKAVWDVNLKDFVRADDGMFDAYKCPVFRNLVVTSTSLPKRIKEEIRDVIDKNGGTFMGALDGSKVKVVLAPKDSVLSEKLKYAMQNNIACLRPEWVFESIKVGYALPFQSFLIKSTKASSTPEKMHAHETFNISSISTIQSDGQQRNYIDESTASTLSAITGFDQTATATATGTADAPSGYVRTLDRLSINDAKTAGPFLDGCCIYLAGFAASHRDKINRILNVGNATRLNDISDAITHVLVGDGSKAAADLKLIKSLGSGPFVLALRWLEESLKLQRPAPEECFLYEEASSAGTGERPAEPPSPLSKRSLQMLRKTREPAVPSLRLDVQEPPRANNRDADLVQQYLQETVAADTSMQQILRVQSSEGDKSAGNTDLTAMRKELEEPAARLFEHTAQGRMSANDSTVPVSQTSSTRRELFEGSTFIVIGFAEDERRNISEGIASLGGTVVSNAYSGIPDFGVVPVTGASLKHTVNEIVTNLYVDDCLLQEQLVEIMYYHRPSPMKKNTKPLASCVITMSMYTGAERQFLSMLAVELGARCQDTFARKTNVEKETYASTHLICPTPEGNKYNAAVKWRLPAVTAGWLLECVGQAKHVDETDFLVGETAGTSAAAAGTPANCRTEGNPATKVESELGDTTSGQPAGGGRPLRNVITPRRHLPPQSGSEDRGTPPINKRLSLVAASKTPQSPFHVSTPGTPYGQVIKPNPSPATRKGWLRYLNDVVDIKVDEPPLKRRPPSTPMSELRRQFWRQAKEPINNGQGDADEESSSGKPPADMNEDTAKTDNATPIKRRLDYPDENSPLPSIEFNQQIVQLQEAFERTSNTADSRQSLSGENANRYYLETADHIENCIGKETQPYSVRWEDPVKTSVDTADPELPTEGEKARGLLRGDGKEQGNEVRDAEREERETVKENDTTLRETSPAQPVTRKFMLSGIKDKSAYENAIRKLGGEVSTEANFDSSATHLLCFRPSRNEKMLASIAAGKWVLHFIYLQDSEEVGRFVDEEKYEWGNPKSKGVIPVAEGPTENAIAAATYRWRLKLSAEPAAARGAFHGMVALLLVSAQKYGQFKRLIEAGGGTVVRAKPPYDTSPGKRITHCFVAQLQQQVDWAMMASKNILCFLPQYLCDYLTAETPPSPRDCVIPDFKKYLTLLPR